MSDHEEEGTQDDSITQNVATLKSMGIKDEDHIKQVLRQTSNDLEVLLSWHYCIAPNICMRSINFVISVMIDRTSKSRKILLVKFQ